MSTPSSQLGQHHNSTTDTIVEREDKDGNHSKTDSDGPKQLPESGDEDRMSLSSSKGEPEEGNVMGNLPKGPLEGRLRQRTPGIDYLRIGNPQAQGSRSKPSTPTIVDNPGEPSGS